MHKCRCVGLIRTVSQDVKIDDVNLDVNLHLLSNSSAFDGLPRLFSDTLVLPISCQVLFESTVLFQNEGLLHVEQTTKCDTSGC